MKSRKNALKMIGKKLQAVRHNSYPSPSPTPYNFSTPGKIESSGKLKKHPTIEEAIDFLAEQWRDDNMCAEKDYYVRKLRQLVMVAFREWAGQ